MIEGVINLCGNVCAELRVGGSLVTRKDEAVALESPSLHCSKVRLHVSCVSISTCVLVKQVPLY